MHKSLTTAQRREVRAFLIDVISNPDRKWRMPEECLYRRSGAGKPNYAAIVPPGMPPTAAWFDLPREAQEGMLAIYAKHLASGGAWPPSKA